MQNHVDLNLFLRTNGEVSGITLLICNPRSMEISTWGVLASQCSQTDIAEAPGIIKILVSKKWPGDKFKKTLTWIFGTHTHHLRVFIAVKRHNDHDSSYKRKYLIRPGLHFRSLVHCPHGREHGSTQTCLERKLRVLHPISREQEQRNNEWATKPILLTYLSNKATPCLTKPYPLKSLLKHSNDESIIIQINTHTNPLI